MIKSTLVSNASFERSGRQSAWAIISMLAIGLAASLPSHPAVAQPGAASQPTTDASRRWELLAHGSGERLWYAVTTPAHSAETPRTIVFEREMQGEWHDLSNFQSRLISLGDLRGGLVASLEGGEWKRISADQFASGPPLPGKGEILALAGYDGKLWAIGFAEGARPEAATPPSTQPATQSVARPATTNAAGPTTRPEQLQLYQLAGENWSRVTALPEEVRTANGREISLVIIKGVPIVAYKDAANLARIVTYSADAKAWSAAGQMQAGFALRKVKLVTAHDKLMGWVVGETGVGSFFFPLDSSAAGDAPWREQPLSVSADVKLMDSSATAAGDELRLFAVRTDQKILERKFDLAGHELKAFEELPPPTNPGESTIRDVVYWGVLGLLMVITLAAANKGGPVQIVTVNNVDLAVAPFALRLAAGLIDLWPAYVGYGLIVFHFRSGVELSQIYSDRFPVVAEIVSLAVYFLHTLVGELIWGRSIGKMFVGLRVVGMDGQRAPIGSIILRNLMRLIEVPGLAGFPLVVIFFNPLRQRLGDFAAGTVIVAKVPREAEKETVAAERE